MTVPFPPSSITSKIVLHSAKVGPASSAFKVIAQASNGSLNMNVSSAPVDSVINLEGSTSNAPVNVVLHPAYEGDVYLASGMSPPMLHVEKNVRDPSGRGRYRSVHTHTFGNFNPGTVEGRVLWGAEDGRRLGSVELSTSNAPLTVTL